MRSFRSLLVASSLAVLVGACESTTADIRSATPTTTPQTKAPQPTEPASAETATGVATTNLSAAENCLSSPLFTLGFLPKDFADVLLPGSGGLITIGSDGSITPIQPIDPDVSHYAGPPGRFIDVRVGEFPGRPSPTQVITVLGQDAAIGTIEDGYSITFTVPSSRCGPYVLLAYGVSETDFPQVAAALAPVAP